jgi:hypothetical protein
MDKASSLSRAQRFGDETVPSRISSTFIVIPAEAGIHKPGADGRDAATHEQRSG